MRLTVLGCAGTFPGPGTACSSYLVEQDGFRLLVDFGNGALGGLQEAGDLRDVDAVVISHLHGDHFLDLVTYTYARRYHPDGASAPLVVYGPPGLAERINGCFERPWPPDLLRHTFDFRTITEGTLQIGPFGLELIKVNHPVTCFAMRIGAGGRSLTYSGDTGVCEALIDLARDTDLFLCEASYLDGADNPPGVHLTGSEAGAHAAEAGARRLVLTHLVPWNDSEAIRKAAADCFHGPLELAAPGAVYDI